MATHRRTVTVINFELQLQWETPGALGFFENLPVGPTVHVTRNNRRVVNAPVAANGRVTLPVPVLSGGSERYAIEIDFAGFEWLDVGAKALLADAARTPNDARGLIRMPALWQSRRQSSFSNDLGGRFARGELRGPTADQQGTAAAPWVLRIDHAWERIYFEWTYYDVVAKAAAFAPWGLLVEGFRAASMRAVDRVGAGSVIHNDGMVCLAIHTRTARNRLHLRLTTAAGTYLNLREMRPKHRMTTRTAAAYAALPGTGKRNLYPMPALWIGRNQRGLHGGASADFASLITRATAPGNRIRFDLDDAMLVSPTGQPIPVPTGSASRLALLDHGMGIKNPDAANPYLSTDTITGNFIPGSFLNVAGQGYVRAIRAIRFGVNFYDVGTRRTTRGNRIGVRAVQRDDHPRERIRAPLTADIGNFDLHYFHDTAVDRHGEPLSHLLVYWSARFRAGPSTGPLTPAQVQAFEPALHDARVRHEGWLPADTARTEAAHKHYYMKPQAAGVTPRRTIKPVFHFAAFRNNQAICRVAVRNNGANSRDWMAQTEAEFQPSSVSPSGSSYTDVDTLSYTWFTFPHEIGHALGLIDEYHEPIDDPSLGPVNWNRPLLPQFQQWWGPRHFSWDEGSLMNSNQAPRLRHFWQYGRWVNSNAAVQALLGNEYKLTYVRGGQTYEYYLPRTRNNYLVPIHSQAGFSNAHGRMDLFLHDTSKDEMSRVPGLLGIAGANDFDAILEVRILCNFNFIGGGWANATRRAELRGLERSAFRHRGGAIPGSSPFFHTLEDASAPRYKKVLVYLEYRHDVGAGAGRHFRFNTHQAAAAGAPASQLRNPATTGATITIHDTDDASSLMRYTLGLSFVTVVPPPAGSPAGTPPTTTPVRGIAAGNLAFLAAWLKTQRDGAADAGGHVHAYVHRRHT